MNTSELTSSLAQRLSLSKPAVTQRLEDAVVAITSELVKGHSISFDDFGTLEIKKREERIIVHPVSEKRMLVPPELVVNFRASESFNDKLKGGLA
jgi:nucleoid DNA-binding protein